MNQKRVSSKVKQKQQQTKLLEQQTKKMQQKLAALRQQVEQQKKLKQANNYQSTLTKWKKATKTEAPLKDYAKQVLADRKEVLNKHGINEKKILGSKSFQPVLSKIKSQKKQTQEKDLSKLPKFQVTSIIQNKKDLIPTENLPIQSIQNNFFKSKIIKNQVIHRKSLQQFLQQNFLQNYLPIFQSNGINDLQDIFHLSRQKMNEMGVKPGHQAKLIKRIKQQLQGKTDTKDTNNSQTLKQKPSQQKISFGYGDGDVNQYIQINKEEQNKKMQNQAKLNNNQINQIHHLDNQEQQQEQEEDDEEQDQDQVIITIPQMNQFSIQANTAQQNQEQDPKEQYNCFQCYKKSVNTPLLSSDNRQFCNEGCLNKYLQFMQKKCPECDQLFYKFNGIYEDGLWFCSIKCSPNHEKIEEMFIQWRQKQRKSSQNSQN